MHNMVYLIGRLTKDLEVKEGESGNKYAFITIACQRSYKNAENVYETDFIPVRMFGVIAENTAEYCKKGDLVGIKGQLQVKDNEMFVVADKITFLASKKTHEEDE